MISAGVPGFTRSPVIGTGKAVNFALNMEWKRDRVFGGPQTHRFGFGRIDLRHVPRRRANARRSRRLASTRVSVSRVDAHECENVMQPVVAVAAHIAYS
ncbi:MAG: hypothetical protein JF591_03005 [Lysobacter sp.]|nr:hypothetical protein [Lysobacter sp.]